MVLIWTPSTAPSGTRMYEAQHPHFDREAQCMSIGDHWEVFGGVKVRCATGEPGVVITRESGPTAKLARAAFEARLGNILLKYGLS